MFRKVEKISDLNNYPTDSAIHLSYKGPPETGGLKLDKRYPGLKLTHCFNFYISTRQFILKL